MKRPPLAAAALVLAFLLSPVAPLLAEESLPALTRKIFNENKDSVVGVTGVAKVSYSAADSKAPLNLPDREQKFETAGTVIDPSGLVVAALSAVDPAKEITGREFNFAQGRVKVEASAILKELKIVMPDGTEVPADIVMKDADLDLAFLKPKADTKEVKSVTFKAIDLKNSVAGEVADDTVTVWRMEEVMNRKPGVMGGQIFAITQKPRTFVRVSSAILGCPTFAMNGKLIGIGVIRSAREKGSVLIVLPAADVLEVAEQAKAAKPAPADEARPPMEKKDAADAEKK